jgi:hypothetical protein
MRPSQIPACKENLFLTVLEQSAGVPDGRTASHDAKIDAIAQAQAGHRLDAAFSPAFLVTTVMSLASSRK